MDLLTALAHEIGHLFGRDHEAGGVMAETPSAGTRRVPDSRTLWTDLTGAVFALDGATEAWHGSRAGYRGGREV